MVEKSHFFAFLLVLSSVSSTPPLVSEWSRDFIDDLASGEKRFAKARLPIQFIPSHYDLEVQINLDDPQTDILKEFEAHGKIVIWVDCTEASDAITLHSFGHVIREIQVTDVTTDPGTEIPVSGHSMNETAQFLIINLASSTVVGNSYKIYIDYITGVVDGHARMDGLYRSYHIENGVRKYIAVTDFESVDARRAWPCFDEPQLKATWTISIVRLQKYISISNTELVSVDRDYIIGPNGNWSRDNYAITVPMSTYLICLTVNDYIEAKAAEGFYEKPVSVWGPRFEMEEGFGEYTPDASAKLMKALETLFVMPYHLTKMDKLVVQQFSAGAMENWGLNTYREERLLWKDGVGTWTNKIALTNTLSHEIVHQWFGNTVTMEWWNDIYLNEAFATYFAPIGVNDAYPEYKLKESFIFNTVQNSMQADIASNTHPLHPPPESIIHPDETRALFTTVTYHKGASVLRMWDSILGENTFITALQKYLVKYEFKNANQDQLFEEFRLQAVADGVDLDGNEIVDICNSWTLKSGFPLVNVVRNLATGSVTFNQLEYRRPVSDEKWIVPVALAYAGDAVDLKPKIWLKEDGAEVVHQGDTNATKWLVVNPGHIGFYRVNYDAENFDLISKALNANHEDFDSQMRSAIIDDALDLALNDYRELLPVLEMTKYLINEREQEPWASFFNRMAYSHRMLSRQGIFYKYRIYMQQIIPPALVPPALESIGYEFAESDRENPSDTILLRNRLFDWACNIGDQKCINSAKSQLALWMETSDPTVILPDQQPSVYCHAIANGGDAEWNFIYDQYLNFDRVFVPDVMHQNLLRSLGCAKEAFRLTKLLDLAMDPKSGIRTPAHRLIAMQAVAANSAGTDLAMRYIRENLDTLLMRYGASMFASVVTTISNHISVISEAEDLSNFILNNEAKLLPVWNSLTASINNINANIDWMRKYYPVFSTFLNSV